MPRRIGAMIDQWQIRRAPVNTARTNATNMAPIKAINDWFGNLEPKDLPSYRVEMFRNGLLERGLSKVTVARYLSVLRAGCNGHLDHIDLGKMISELKRGPNLVECWTKEEAKKIIEVTKEHWNGNGSLDLFAELLFATGCRRGEALALQCEDVDFNKKRIHFHRSLALDGSLQNGTKWGGERWFPMSSPMMLTFRDYLGPGGEIGTLLTCLDQRTVGRNFKQMCEWAEVPTHKMHCTRHSAISWALAGGVTLRKASEIFGVSQATLEKHYAHFVDEDVDMSWATL